MPAPVVVPRLGAAPADRHGAPRSGSAPGVVVEGPVADVPHASLQPSPPPADAFRDDDPGDPGESRVHAPPRGLQAMLHITDLRDERESGELSVEIREDRGIESDAVVGERERPQELAYAASPIEIW